MPLTSTQVTWFQGYWSYFQGSPRPAPGPKRDGWDAAKRCDSGGGYG